jgi:hypothetical protein
MCLSQDRTELRQFFETFKEFEGRAFHMAGESYGVSDCATDHIKAYLLGSLPSTLCIGCAGR